MRIDKFLWAVRQFKTRGLASTAIKKGKVKINGQVVKPSREVVPTDSILIKKQLVEHRIAVIQIPPSRIGAKLLTLYVKDTTPQEQKEKQELRRLDQDYYRAKGEGRPTKKDRRELDDFMDTE